MKTDYFCRMQRASYKISAILLCGLLIYNSLGYFLVLSVVRMAVRQQKWAQLSSIPDQQLTIFVFNKEGANPRLKAVNKHEILVDGKLYDVARKIEKGTSVTYYCLRDSKEESLIARTRIFNSQQHQLPANNTARLIAEKIIKTAVVKDKTVYISGSYSNHFFSFKLSPYIGPYSVILVPPPRPSC
ncbi:MAG: hypothetical protein WCI92_14495 [Bacteroidota bacterium]